MLGKFLVLGEKVEKVQFKNGPREFVLVNLLDMSDPRLTNTLDYEMSEDEKPAHAGKLLNKTVEVGLTELATAFGGRLRGKGRIVSVSGANGSK